MFVKQQSICYNHGSIEFTDFSALHMFSVSALFISNNRNRELHNTKHKRTFTQSKMDYIYMYKI